MSTIYYAADSTVQYNSILTYPQTGMGQVLHLYLKPEVTVCNHAINGRSTKSFLEQGRLEPIYEQMKEGDFLFIQFGHNDEKKEDPLRFTTPFGTYQENLEKFVVAAREKKAIPVFITPIERRCFDEEGKLGPGKHTEYVKAMKELAERLDVACIDLNARSRAILSEYGPEKAKQLHVVVPAGIYPNFPEGKDDPTHLCYSGAVCYCGCLADELRKLGGVYADILL